MRLNPEALRRATIYIEWSELFQTPLDDELVDLWVATAGDDQALVQAMSETAQAFQAAHPGHALRLLDVVGEVDAVHDVDVAATIMAIARTHPLDEWAPTISHNLERIDQLVKLRRRGVRIGIVSDSVWSRIWVSQFLDRDGVPYNQLIVANEGNYDLSHPEAWSDAMMRLGPGSVICSNAIKSQGAHLVGLQVAQWDHIDNLLADS